MKTFLLFLAVSLAASEKLDRTYLPPPGAKFSGGVPGDIQAPFEIPKEGPSRPQFPFNNRPVTPEDTRIEVGINRGLPSEIGDSSDSVSFSPGTNAPIDYTKVPTTTTSYAFTQTTTHPPGEGFETTLGPINPITGFPTTAPFNEFQTTAPGFINFPQNVNQGQSQQIVPGFQQPGVFGQQGGLFPSPGISQYPGSPTTAPTQDSPTIIGQNRPLPQGNLNQYQDGQRLGFASGIQKPGFVSQAPGQDLPQYQGNRYPTDNNNSQIDTISSNISPQGTTTRPAQFGSNLNKIQGTSSPSLNIPFSQDATNSFVPSEQLGVDQQQKHVSPGQQLPPAFVQQGANVKRPGQDQYQLNIQPGTNIQDQRLGQDQYQSRPGFVPQQYPTQVDQFGRPLQPQPGQIFSTASPTSPDSNQYPSSPAPQQYPNQVDQFGRPVQPRPGQVFSTGSPTISDLNQYSTTPGTSPTTASPYPSGSFQSTPSYPGISQGNLQNRLIPRPERPQAEADRNAVILDYQSVITPDGEFAYSFDTSNGIHADESGTAVDGVRANGSYSYIGDDGKLYSVVYTADENGFQPRGDHLPTPPPIPEAIQKVIDQVNRDKDAGVSDDGTYDDAKYGHEKYQGGRYRPQRPNQTVKTDVDLQEKDDYQFSHVDRKQQRPQKQNKRPIVLEEGPQDYNETVDEQDLINGDEVRTNNRKRPMGKVPSRRPANRIPDQGEEKYKFVGGVEDNDNRKKPIGKTPSRRPYENQDGSDTFGEEDITEDNDERQPGSKVPIRRPGQPIDRNRRPIGKIPSRPSYDQSDDFDTTYDDGSGITDIEQTRPPVGSKNRLRPINKDRSRYPTTPTSIYDPISNQYVETDEETKYSQNVPGEKFYNNDRIASDNVPRVPGLKYDNGKNYYDLKTGVTRVPITEMTDSSAFDKYNQNRGRPEVSSTYAPQIETEDSFDKLDSFGDRTSLPGKTNFAQKTRPIDQRPGINRYTTAKPSFGSEMTLAPQNEIDTAVINAPGKTSVFDQNLRRPAGQRPGTANIYTTVRPSIDQESTFSPQTGPEDELDFTRADEPGQNYSFGQNIIRPSFSRRPGDRNKPPTFRPIDQEMSVPQIQSEYDNRTKFPGKTADFNQRVRGPALSQRPGEVTRYTTTAKPFDDETGYQYIPPQRKFEQGTQFPGSPNQENTYFEKNGDSIAVPKPFTTPDVTRGEVIPEQDIDRIQGNRNQLPGSVRPSQQGNLPNANQPQFNNYDQNNGPEYYNEKNEELTNDNDGKNDINRIPPQSGEFSTISSTGRPSYQNNKGTFQPQQQFRPGTKYGVSQDLPSGTSTTPIPSQSTRFEVTKPSYRPGLQGTDRYIESSRPPKIQGYDFVSTTRMPPQATDFGTQTKGAYEGTPSQSLYQMTYRPMVTINSNVDSNKIVPGPVRSGYHVTTGRPGVYSQNQVPSTTYRPGYFSTERADGDMKPAVDAYGKPIEPDVTRLDGTTFRPGYAPGSRGQNVRFPSSGENQDGRQPFVQFTDSKQTTKYGSPPSGQTQGTNYEPYQIPSSTEKVIGEDFSGPKQQQRFDPERGYYY